MSATTVRTQEGRHRAIREHAFVQYRGADRHGCGYLEDGFRCGFYRRFHPTMLNTSDTELRREAITIGAQQGANA